MMLVLKRRDGEWLEIAHVESGDVLRVRLYDIRGETPGHQSLSVLFDDPDRNFSITRPDRAIGNERTR